MSEKINLYVKFIQNEQKKLKVSTVVSPHFLEESKGRPTPRSRNSRGEVVGPRGPILRTDPPQREEPSRELPPMLRAKRPHETWTTEPPLPRPDILGTSRSKPESEPTVSPSSTQKTRPRREFKGPELSEPAKNVARKLAPPVAAAAVTGGIGAGIYHGIENPRGTEAPSPGNTPPEPPKAAEPQKPAEPAEPQKPAEPAEPQKPAEPAEPQKPDGDEVDISDDEFNVRRGKDGTWTVQTKPPQPVKEQLYNVKRPTIPSCRINQSMVEAQTTPGGGGSPGPQPRGAVGGGLPINRNLFTKKGSMGDRDKPVGVASGIIGAGLLGKEIGSALDTHVLSPMRDADYANATKHDFFDPEGLTPQERKLRTDYEKRRDDLIKKIDTKPAK